VDDLQRVLDAERIDARVELAVVRDGARRTVTVRPQELSA
jgi:S1-C subfamily serine protease